MERTEPNLIDEAVEAADRALATVDPDIPRSALAAEITLAVAPVFLPLISDLTARLTQSHAENIHYLELQTEALNLNTARLRRIAMVFQEMDHAAIADQFLGLMTQAGREIGVRDAETIHWVVASTIRRVFQSLALALETDLSDLTS